MSLTEDEILELLKFIEESDFDEMHLEMPGLKLSVGKGTNKILSQGIAPIQSKADPLIAQEGQTTIERTTEERTNTGDLVETEQQKTVPLAPAAAPIDEEGFISIKSPVLGIFYRSPKPGAPSFVEVGQYVTEEDTVCLIEVMKLFNAVKAGVRGRVVKICAENSEMVEYHQTLFLLEPGEESSEESEGH